MAKGKRSKRVQDPEPEEDVEPTLETAFAEDDVDDEVDDFVSGRDKILLGEDASDDGDGDSDGDDAVLGIDADDSDESDDDDDGSEGESGDEGEEEGEDADEDASDSEQTLKNWGKKRTEFYDADYVDPDYGLGESDLAEAKEEEAEVRRLQAAEADALEEDDFGLPFGLAAESDVKKVAPADDTDSKRKTEMVEELDTELNSIAFDGLVSAEVVQRDLSSMSEDDRIAHLAEHAPELLDLCDEYGDRIQELEVVRSAVELKDRLPAPAAAYFETRHQLLLHYLLNIGYYLYLRSLGRSTLQMKTHPCIDRLVKARSFFEQLAPLHDSYLDVLSDFAAAEQAADGTDDDAAGVDVGDVHADSEPSAASDNDDKEGESDVEDDDTDEDASERQKPSETAPASSYAEIPFAEAKVKRKELAATARKKKKKRNNAALDFGDVRTGDDELAGERKARRKKERKEKEEMLKQMEGLADGANELEKDDAADAFFASVMKSKKQHKADKEERAKMPERPDDDGRFGVTGDNRAITWSMKKNKGLTPSRKKEVRNPRVRNKNKFVKAQKKRKGQVREMRTEADKRYRGEEFGIKSTVIRSVKLK